MINSDQKRALHAYICVGNVRQEQQKDYQIAINDLGSTILKSGLCAAIANIQRVGDRASLVLEHLATAGVPGLTGVSAHEFSTRIQKLDADAYMLATRELLKVSTWLKRAAQATFKGQKP